MSQYESRYTELVTSVIQFGERRETRAGPTRQMFGRSFCINELRSGLFPILTARKMFYKPVFGELAAFLRGATKLKTFQEFGCNYWDANARAWSFNRRLEPDNWEVGQIYGAQWRNWQAQDNCDQIKNLVRNLICEPRSRRHLLTTYDPEETHACLPPCHLLAQFDIDLESRLNCCVYMRSVDLCLGLPADVTLYAALLILLANETNLKPGSLTFMLGDTHIYENHVDKWLEFQSGAIRHELPTYKLQTTSIDTFVPENLVLNNYTHGERIDYQFNV